MGDSWEDDDFEVPVLANNFTASVAVREEEEDQAAKAAAAAAPIVKASGVLRREQEEQEAIARKIQDDLHADETPAQKKLRERLQAEEADTKLAGELFQGNRETSEAARAPVSVVSSVAGIPLRTKEDHSKLGTLLSKRLANSSAFNVAAFYKGLLPALSSATITTETLDEIIRDITAIRASRAVAEKPVKAVPVKKSKKEIEAENRKHADKFGGYDEVDKYDHYTSMEDDFM